ncbi:transcription termination/antitermination NusG family protein [Mesorhizobium sp. NPDC059025]|uniref:transcription termination/antitermination NusG family protein n=1 Tax=unclassified Mesorhizobium TaxID=325217 RepID=UPI0036AB53B7
MNWYAIRTVPGSQKPQREYAVETTSLDKDGRPRGKGYRIVPSLNPNYSAVELALSRSGFTYYMPAEKRLQRDRLKPYLWKTRRFALMVGYIFVRDPQNWSKLLETPGVVGAVTNGEGKPLVVDFVDMLKIRSAEGAAEAAFDDQLRKARHSLRKAAKKNPDLQKLVDDLDIRGTMTAAPPDGKLAA